MTEAEKVSELHQEVKNNLLNEDLEKVKNWQKDSYHKQMMGGFKETKEAEEGFRKAQKPWAKKLKEVRDDPELSFLFHTSGDWTNKTQNECNLVLMRNVDLLLDFNVQMEAAKKSYHMACKEEKIASTREANSKAEASVTSDQQKKLQEKLDKSKNDVQKVRPHNDFIFIIKIQSSCVCTASDRKNHLNT